MAFTIKEVEVIGIYHGEDKPSHSNILLQMFTEEISNLINNGIVHNEKRYNVKFFALVCDTPAKAYVLNVKYHTGYYNCTKCIIEGEYIKGKVCFPGESKALRTNELFRNHAYNMDYQCHERSILNDIPNFGCVTNVPLDYMHLVCLGVMLKLIELWLKGPINVRLLEHQRKQISERLVHLKKFMPSDFSRAPRKFKNIRRVWKAHELRQFLLYSGPVVLKDILNEHLYANFLHLHIAISILVNPKLVKNDEYLNFAEVLLKRFIISYESIYGKDNVSFNTHNLLHLVNDVRNYGPLDNFSAFKYENHIRKVKAMVRKGDKPLQQIAKRLAEINSATEYYTDETDKNNLNNANFELLHPFGINRFHMLKKNTITINCKDEKNNGLLLKNSVYLTSHYFMNSNELYVIGYRLTIKKSLYTSPINSDVLNIEIVKRSNDLEMYPGNLIVAKLCKMPFRKNYVVFPLIHSIAEFCD